MSRYSIRVKIHIMSKFFTALSNHAFQQNKALENKHLTTLYLESNNLPRLNFSKLSSNKKKKMAIFGFKSNWEFRRIFSIKKQKQEKLRESINLKKKLKELLKNIQTNKDWNKWEPLKMNKTDKGILKMLQKLKDCKRSMKMSKPDFKLKRKLIKHLLNRCKLSLSIV